VTAQSELAVLKHDPVLAEEVADAFELVIECFPQALQPLSLKHCEKLMIEMRKAADLSSV